MRLKKLFLFVVAMVMAIPTMFAQDPVYFAYNTSTGRFATPLTEAGELTYDGSSTYTGQIKMVQSSLTGNKAVLFYTGSADAPTFIGSGMASMATQLNMASATNLATRNQAYGWYITKTNLESAGGDSSVEATFNVTLNMANPAAPTVSFELVKEEQPENPLEFFVWSYTGSWNNIGTLTPTSEGGTTYVGSISTTRNDQSFVLSPVGTDWRSGTAIGQKGDTSGSSQTRDVNLSTVGSSTTINMAAGTTSTTITLAGTYTFTFDMEAMTLKVALESLDVSHPSEIRVLMGSSATDLNSSSYVLKQNSDGTYSGSFAVNPTNKYFKFYSQVGSVNTYYGNTGNFGASNQTIPFANNPTPSFKLSSNSDATKVGAYDVGYPDNNFSDNGTVTAILDLENNMIYFTLEVGAPTNLYLLGSTTKPTSWRDIPDLSVQASPTSGVFTWDLAVPEGGYSISISNTDNSYQAPRLTAGNVEIDATTELYKGTWSVVAMTNYNFGRIAQAGNYKVVLDYATKTVTIYNEDVPADETLYIHIAPSYANGPWEISDGDQALTEGEDGYFTTTVENVAKNSGVRFYTIDRLGNPVWIGPEMVTRVNFDQTPEYTGTYVLGSSSWHMSGLVNGATSATVTFSIDPEAKKVIFKDLATPIAPEAMYIWSSNSTDDEGNPLYKMIGALEPSADNENLFEGSVEIPANSMFYLGTSATSAAEKAYKAAYENFSDGGGSSVSGTEPAVKFTNGQYAVTLYRNTVAPNGAPTTSINFAAGGTVEMTFDFTTGNLTVTEPAQLPEYIQISVAKAGPPTGSVVPAPETDARLEMTSEGVYEGTLDIQTSRMFYFYSVANGAVANTYNSPSGFPTMGTAIYLDAENQSWPYDEDTAEDAVITENKAAKTSWTISYGASASIGTFDVTVDLNKMTLSIAVAEKEPEAPEALYLWGTENGYAGTGWKAWENGTFTKDANSNVYTLEVSVPECGPFEDVTGDGKSETDTETGFYFFLNSSATTQTGAARVFMPAATDRVIDLTAEGDSYSATVTEDKTGASFICITPGDYTFKFDFDKMEFTATLNELPVSDPCSLVLNFEGTNFELGDDINDYLTILDMAALMGSEGENTGELDINANPYTYVYTEYFPEMAMLQVTPAKGYSLELKADEDVENLYLQGGETGVWMIQGGALYNVPVTVSITKEPNTMTFKFTGVTDAYTHVQAADFDGTTVDLTSDTYVVEYESQGGLSIQPNDGYSLRVECVTPDYNPNAFTIQGTSSNESSQVVVFGSEAANGYEFEVTVLESKNTMTFTFEGVENAYTHVQATDYDGVTVDLTSNIYQVEYETVGGLSLVAEEGYAISVECVTPDADPTAYQIMGQSAGDVNSTTVFGTAAANGYNFVVKVSEAPNTMTFTFEGVENAYTHVEASDYDGETVELTSNIYRVEYDKVGGLSLVPEEGYSLSVKCVTPDADPTAYQIGGQSFGDVTATTVFGTAAANGYNFVVTVSAAKNSMTFTFEGVADAYTHVQASDYDGETVELTTNICRVEYETVGGLSLVPDEGYAISVECVTPDADPTAYQIGGQAFGDVEATTVFGTAAANGYNFVVKVSEVKEPAPENGVRFEFTGLENGWELFQITDLVTEDDLDITGNTVDYTYQGMAGLMLGFNQDVNAEDYVWTITCEDGEEGNGTYILGDDVMDGQHAQRMLTLWQGAYGYTFTINISRNAAKTVNFVITGTMDAEQGTANAFRHLTVLAEEYTEDFDPKGETTIYFDSPDYAYSFDGFATWTLVPAVGYMIKDVTADVNPGGDTFMYDPDTNEIALYEGGYTITITLMSDDEDGIANIYDLDGAEGYTVVNMQGTVLLRNGSAADLNLLEKGMYIVNGKKIVIRK